MHKQVNEKFCRKLGGLLAAPLQQITTTSSHIDRDDEDDDDGAKRFVPIQNIEYTRAKLDPAVLKVYLERCFHKFQ